MKIGKTVLGLEKVNRGDTTTIWTKDRIAGDNKAMEQAPQPVYQLLIDAVARDYPATEVSVTFPNRWELVHRFRSEGRPLYVAGFPPSREQPRGDHFLGLPGEINRSLTTYRLYKLFEPRSISLFQVAWNSYIGQGRIIGGAGQRVNLSPLGQAQMWRGETAGVVWECFFDEAGRQRQRWPEELATFWQAVERDMAVDRVFTQPREPTFEQGYPEFLSRLGYTLDPDCEGWWSKRR